MTPPGQIRDVGMQYLLASLFPTLTSSGCASRLLCLQSQRPQNSTRATYSGVLVNLRTYRKNSDSTRSGESWISLQNLGRALFMGLLTGMLLLERFTLLSSQQMWPFGRA